MESIHADNISAERKELIERAVEYQDQWLLRNEMKSPKEPVTYEIGDLVLYKPPEGRAHKLQPLWLGPVVITGQYRKNDYIVHNAATGMVRTLSVDRLKPYRTDPLTPDTAVALTDDDMFIVEEIVRHKLVGRKKKKQAKKDYHFLVKFQGYEEPEWQMYNTSLARTTPFQDYVTQKSIETFC